MKNFNFLKRVLWLLIPLLTLFNIVTWGSPAPANTILWAETWTDATCSNGSSGQSSANPDDNCSTSKGTTIYGGASISYTQSSSSYVYCRNESSAGGTAPELFIKGSNTWTISGISTGEATTLTLTYNSNKSPTVTVSTTEKGKNPSISGSSKNYTITTDGASTISLVFSASENSRVDNVSLTVKTAAPSYTVGWSITAGGGSLSATSGTSTTVTPTSGWRYATPAYSVLTGSATVAQSTNTFTATPTANSTIRINMEEIPTHKAYFYNGSTLLNTGGTSFAEGAAVSYGGSDPTSCDTGDGASTTFVGWATDTWTGKVAKASIVPTFYDISAGESLPNMSTGDVTYYAVFAKAGTAGSPTEKFSVDLQTSSPSAPTGYTLTHATEWKNSSYRQDGSNDPAYVKIYHTSTKLFSIVPSVITVKAELAGGVARDPLNNSVYAVFLDNSGNEIDGSAAVLCTAVTTSYVEKSVNMPTNKATNAYGIKIRHAKESSYNVRYKSLTLTYATATDPTNYMTSCCTPLGSINGSFL